jgi:hypothetical protein
MALSRSVMSELVDAFRADDGVDLIPDTPLEQDVRVGLKPKHLAQPGWAPADPSRASACSRPEPPSRSKSVQAAAGGHPVQPGPERGPSLEPGQAPPGRQLGLLQRQRSRGRGRERMGRLDQPCGFPRTAQRQVERAVVRTAFDKPGPESLNLCGLEPDTHSRPLLTLCLMDRCITTPQAPTAVVTPALTPSMW